MISVRLIRVTNTFDQEELYNNPDITILAEKNISVDVSPWEKVQYIRYLIHQEDEKKGTTFKGLFY